MKKKQKKEERFIKRHVYLTIIGMIIIAFIAGIILGRFSTTSDIDEVSSFVKDNELSTESYLIEQSLLDSLGKDSCDLSALSIEKLSHELWLLGKSLTQEDAKEKLGEDNFNYLKRRFHLLQIRAYIKYKELKENCDIPTHIILYYYNTDDAKSLEQGLVLDKLVNAFDLQVFAIEYDYSTELSFLEEYYSITAAPAIIVDFEQKFEEPVSYRDLAPLVG